MRCGISRAIYRFQIDGGLASLRAAVRGAAQVGHSSWRYCLRLSWEQATEQDRDTRFVELARYLCEVRAGQHWRVDRLRSLDGFLEKKFPESRWKDYYLMAIHERLSGQIHKGLKQLGWTKAKKLARVARAEGQRFDCAPWMHKASTMDGRNSGGRAIAT